MASNDARSEQSPSSRTCRTVQRDAVASCGVGRHPRTPVLRDLLAVVRLVDVVALVVLPALLVAAFALPAPVRRDLAFSYADPTIATAYVSHFVHLHATHLATNLVVYALVVPVAYLLCALSDRRTEFYVAAAAFVLALPFALSALNVALVRPRVGYGFSGVNTAFFGFLPVALFGYLSTKLELAVEPRDAPALFFAGVALVAVVAVPASTTSLSVAVVAAVAAGAYFRERYPGLAPLSDDLATLPRATPGYVELAVVSAGVFAAFPFAAFPADPASDGFVVNLYAHLLGYALGFISSYVTFSLVGLDGDDAGLDPAAEGR